MAMTEEFMNVFELQYVSSFKLYDKYLKDIKEALVYSKSMK